jgi:hypothetical protein
MKSPSDMCDEDNINQDFNSPPRASEPQNSLAIVPTQDRFRETRKSDISGMSILSVRGTQNYTRTIPGIKQEPIN